MKYAPLILILVVIIAPAAALEDNGQQASATPLLPAGLVREGVGFQPITPPQPTHVPPGKIQITEAFSYGCGHCYDMQPHIERWLKIKPDYIQFDRLHVAGHATNKSYARLFYALEELGRGDLHQKVFESIFDLETTLIGKSEEETSRIHQEFSAAHGIRKENFDPIYRSPAVQAKIARALQFSSDLRLIGTPVLIVNGKYQLYMSQANHEANVIAMANDIAALEIAHCSESVGSSICGPSNTNTQTPAPTHAGMGN